MTGSDPRGYGGGLPSPLNALDPAAVERAAKEIFAASFPGRAAQVPAPAMPDPSNEEALSAQGRPMGVPHGNALDPGQAYGQAQGAGLRQGGETPLGGTDPRHFAGLQAPPPSGPPTNALDPALVERLANGAYRTAFPGRAASAGPTPLTPPLPVEAAGFERAVPPTFPPGAPGMVSGTSAAPSAPPPAVPMAPSQPATAGPYAFDLSALRHFGDPVQVYRPSAPTSPPGTAPAAPATPGAAPVVTAAARGEEPPFYFLAQEPRPAAPPTARAPSDANQARRDFPLLQQTVHGKPLVWLDNAATTQKPRAVIDSLVRFYERDNSNIHRGAHMLAARATQAFENARTTVQRFLGAASDKEIVFVRGCTEAINLVAFTYARKMLLAGDEVVLTQLEHHSNIVPWQMVCREKGALLRVAPVDDRGDVILEEYDRLLGPRTRLVAITQVSNALGTVVPVREMTQMAHRYGARVLIDGAQSVAHMPVDVQALDADFFVFSGHKIFAPTGIGALYAKFSVLEQMPPWQGGGNMIESVSFEHTTYRGPPDKFEAGTADIGGAVGLGAALDYLSRIGMDSVERYERDLMRYLLEGLATVPGLRRLGAPTHQAGAVSFVMDGMRPEDVGRYLDQEGIAVRSGHHCAQPALRRFGVTSSVRPSLALYNTRSDVDALVGALRRIRRQ